MNVQHLAHVASALVAKNKGILAADESMGTIEKRFTQNNIPVSEVTRIAYRDLLFTTPHIEDYISGVILFDETIRGNAHNGNNFARLLLSKEILPGIKVDKGVIDMALFPGEKITEGLDGLASRLSEYKNFGAHFTKWRAVITIGDGIPSDTCINANAELLARYAAIVQQSDLVPIVEPEVVMDGKHSIDDCRKVTYRTLKALFMKLSDHRVSLSGMLLKPNMIVAGKESGEQFDAVATASATLEVLREVVPPEVPGIVFLSGGIAPVDATKALQELNVKNDAPWQLTFSFARALQDEAMKEWQGKDEHIEKAQRIFLHRAKMNSFARHGKYTSELEQL